ncbi:aspartate/glutamate racemase family protein [Streptomyces sp. GMR22]|uniref:aspartate/glutamate racemase family protein n=1 Tax=Streptomyces sp. GMR22 TaxID=2759524 RepID=UPI0015F9B7B8|nr:aspartate/glutamate racemase family protein [Streptomyces sp. GMR22]MBA6440761.1 hydantoin racemase [Streptomyces sp. GMR22]
MRLCFLNPFGTPAYDQLIRDVVEPSLRPDTELEVRHLDTRPENIDYFAAKHLVETDIMKAGLRAERDGFDAFIIGCCYDPALTQTREILGIPVVGPLEASTAFTRPFGHRYAVVTDHHKAVPELEDRLRVYGQAANCRAVTSVGWFIDKMVLDTAAVAEDAFRTSQKVMADTGAETVIIGCTIVSACYEKAALSDPRLRRLSVINPNLIAVKQAEVLAELAAQGQYRISRAAYYQPLSAHDPAQDEELRSVLAAPGAVPAHPGSE